MSASIWAQEKAGTEETPQKHARVTIQCGQQELVAKGDTRLVSDSILMMIRRFGLENVTFYFSALLPEPRSKPSEPTRPSDLPEVRFCSLPYYVYLREGVYIYGIVGKNSGRLWVGTASTLEKAIVGSMTHAGVLRPQVGDKEQGKANKTQK